MKIEIKKDLSKLFFNIIALGYRGYQCYHLILRVGSEGGVGNTTIFYVFPNVIYIYIYIFETLDHSLVKDGTFIHVICQLVFYYQ